ncbi:hypothetical protein [Halobacteriovorax sp.]|uniref:hypothetical protein n=1 Tax=Halobacteriovorax sp. TaxID=2020862 RepID=UPI003AF231D4
MKSITLPFLLFMLISQVSFAQRGKTLRLRGRVPASVKVVTNNKEKGGKDTIKSNIDKQSYTIRKVRKINHEIYEISFH